MSALKADPRAANEGLKSSYRLALASADHAADRARVAASILASQRYGSDALPVNVGDYATEPSVAEWLAMSRDWQTIARQIGRAIVWDDADLYPPF